MNTETKDPRHPYRLAAFVLSWIAFFVVGKLFAPLGDIHISKDLLNIGYEIWVANDKVVIAALFAGSIAFILTWVFYFLFCRLTFGAKRKE